MYRFIWKVMAKAIRKATGIKVVLRRGRAGSRLMELYGRDYVLYASSCLGVVSFSLCQNIASDSIEEILHFVVASPENCNLRFFSPDGSFVSMGTIQGSICLAVVDSSGNVVWSITPPDVEKGINKEVE
jgi:hypothetical protein